MKHTDSGDVLQKRGKCLFSGAKGLLHTKEFKFPPKFLGNFTGRRCGAQRRSRRSVLFS
jgi:hypothetical protein